MPYRYLLTSISTIALVGSLLGACTTANQDVEKIDTTKNHEKIDSKATRSASTKNIKVIFFQEAKTGKVAILNAPDFKKWDTVSLESGTAVNIPGYDIVDVGDLNQDKVDDILFQNRKTGENVYFDGKSKQWKASINTPGVEAVAIGDVNNDGINNILFYNPKNGQALYYEDSTKKWEVVEDTQGNKPIAIGDVNGDGADDIIFADAKTGSTIYKDVEKGEFLPIKSNNGKLLGDTPQWIVSGIGDMNQDGINDVLFQGPKGETTYWDGDKGDWSTTNITVIPGWKPVI